MALPKDKGPKERQKNTRPEGKSFDPFWTNRKVDSLDEYIQTACRERPGFHRGARIK
jgi:hypothetical protein